MARLECSECGAKKKVSDEHVGKKVRCPGCGAPVKVLGAGEVSKGPPVKSKRPAEGPLKKRPKAAPRADEERPFRPPEEIEEREKEPWENAGVMTVRVYGMIHAVLYGLNVLWGIFYIFALMVTGFEAPVWSVLLPVIGASISLTYNYMRLCFGVGMFIRSKTCFNFFVGCAIFELVLVIGILVLIFAGATQLLGSGADDVFAVITGTLAIILSVFGAYWLILQGVPMIVGFLNIKHFD